jgi:aminopeptidase-like protein/aminoglycoside N3'-acetyltransferase
LLTKNILISEFKLLGIQPGDTLFVHSSYSSLSQTPGGMENGPQTVIDALLSILGENGTLIMPTFNYDFLRGEKWDIRSTPSQMGILTELVRKDPGAKRMFHPIYSVAAIGRLADEIETVRSDDCFGDTTIFKKLRDWNAKIVVIGLPYSKSFTFLHHCEQMANVDYRYLKEFSGTAIDQAGIPHEMNITMFVRDVDKGVVLDFEPIGKILDDKVAKIRQIGLSTVRLLDVNQSYEVSVDAIQKFSGPGLTYQIESKEKAIDWLPSLKPISSLKDVLAEFFPLHRTLASDDMDKTLEIIGSYLPENANYTIETFPPLSQVWTWYVPERYEVKKAYLETEDGEKIVDFHDNYLHLVSYSLPVDKMLNWEELQPHLYFNENLPHTIPWNFKYYERDWGFCLTKNQFDRLPRDKRYHAVIDAEFVTDPEKGFKVATAVVHPKGGPNPEAGEIFIMAHTCHPNQANDDAAGVVTAIEIARQLCMNPLPAGSMSVRFWFGPETIGTITYLANHEERIPDIRAGIFIEMTGNNYTLALQRSRQNDTLIDRIGHHVLTKNNCKFREGAFAEIIANDERVLNGPGINVPTISLTRYPYPEYHTSDDNLSIIHEDKLLEAAKMIEEIIRIFATNYIPVRKFRGPVFLSGYGLYVDWQDDWELNRNIEKIMMRFEGEQTVFDIVEELDLAYWDTRKYIEKFRINDLIDAVSIPKIAEEK